MAKSNHKMYFLQQLFILEMNVHLKSHYSKWTVLSREKWKSVSFWKYFKRNVFVTAQILPFNHIFKKSHFCMQILFLRLFLAYIHIEFLLLNILCVFYVFIVTINLSPFFSIIYCIFFDFLKIMNFVPWIE